MLDSDGIRDLLPHREPFLLVDEVVELEPGQRGVGVKHVRAEEPWFAGHFPGNPIMPGVLIAEALAQMAGVVILSANDEHAGNAVYLAGMDKLRFRRPVRPGESLRLEVEITRQRRSVVTFDANATVDGQRVASGSFMAALASED